MSDPVDTKEAKKLKKEGDQYLKRGDFFSAINSYRAALGIYPDYKEALCGIGIAHSEIDIDKAIELYTELADETPQFFNKEFIESAREKLDFFAGEPKMIEDIQKYLAGYESRKEKGISVSDAIEEITESTPVIQEEPSGNKKIRVRNARIRSRYFTN